MTDHSMVLKPGVIRFGRHDRRSTLLSACTNCETGEIRGGSKGGGKESRRSKKSEYTERDTTDRCRGM